MSDLQLVDGGEQTIKCASCNKPLMHYRTYTNVNTTYKIIAECPFCSDKSFTTEIQGTFWYGPIGQDESHLPTIISNIDMQNDGITIFKVERVPQV